MNEAGPQNPQEQPSGGEEDFVHDDLPQPADQQDDLDGLRIRQITKMRRSANRTRGYLLVASVVCVALAGQLIWISVGKYRNGALVVAVGCVLASMILLALAWRAMLRSRELKAEVDRSLLPEPKTPPDFSKLSDGSQAWKNLEDVE